MKSIYEIAMDLCKIRDRYEPIKKGTILRSNCLPGEWKPSERKVRLSDAREACELNHVQLNAAINALLEHHTKALLEKFNKQT